MYDIIIRNGSVLDGSGSPHEGVDLAVAGDEIARIGDLSDSESVQVLDASGLVVAPGFINMLSHSYFSLMKDPRSMSELKQGVTTQVFGEGFSMGPLTDDMRHYIGQYSNGDIQMSWNRLSEFLSMLEQGGISQNIASFVGSWNPRTCVLGTEDRPPSRAELDRMCALVEEEMSEGALGIGSALIYPPGSFAATDELIALCRAAAKYEGMYISHMRSEGAGLLDAVDELLEISRRAELPAEIYHLKAAGRSNWDKMPRVIERVEEARARGQGITADLYPYTAGATALFSIVPPRFRSGRRDKHVSRLKHGPTRWEIRTAIEGSEDGWENLWAAAGGAEGIVVLSASSEEFSDYRGMSLAAIAQDLGRDDALGVALDMLERDPSIGAAFFLASEDNIRRQLETPWVSIGSDAASIAPEQPFLDAIPHPRAYGTFARVLRKYVRQEKVIGLAEAVRRLTSLPGETLGLDRRGRIREGWFADMVIFDNDAVTDTATYGDPHRYAVGIRDVLVNGHLVLRDGEHTSRFPGRALKGPGYRP